MSLISDITEALDALPESDRLDMAIAIAAHFTGAYMVAERAVSAGYARKDPKRVAVTIKEIIQGAVKHGE